MALSYFAVEVFRRIKSRPWEETTETNQSSLLFHARRDYVFTFHLDLDGHRRTDSGALHNLAAHQPVIGRAPSIPQ